MSLLTVVEAPAEFHAPSVFLGGSITGAEDWQSRFIAILGAYRPAVEMAVLNPRRGNFDVKDPNESVRQIRWESRHLRRADALVFWFSPETLAPITLLELGAHTHSSGKPIFVGVHRDYSRRLDVEVQCGLVRPDVRVVYDVESLVAQVVTWYHRSR